MPAAPETHTRAMRERPGEVNGMGRVDPDKAPAAGGPPGRVAPHALVYVPGLQLAKLDDKSVVGVVARLQAACEHYADTRAATWSARWGERWDGRGEPPVARIVRHDPGVDSEEPALDVFHYDWVAGIGADASRKGRGRRLLRLGFVMAGAPSFLRFFLRSRSTPRGRMQLFAAFVMLLIAFAYTAVLFAAVAATAWDALRPDAPEVASVDATSTPAATAERREDAGGKTGGKRVTFGLQLSALAGALGARMFGATWLKERLTTAGDALLVARNYLRLAEHQPAVTRGLADLVETLTEEGYADITVVAYSFGGVIAVDTLFPSGHVAEKGLACVRGVVTIGLPLQFAEAIRPGWLGGRRFRPGTPAAWHNIYGTVDLLGSEVTVLEDWSPGVGEEAEPPRPRNHPYNLGVEATAGNVLEMYGFASHGMYWGLDKVEDRNVFDLVVTELYEGTPVLA